MVWNSGTVSPMDILNLKNHMYHDSGEPRISIMVQLWKSWIWDVLRMSTLCKCEMSYSYLSIHDPTDR